MDLKDVGRLLYELGLVASRLGREWMGSSDKRKVTSPDNGSKAKPKAPRADPYAVQYFERTKQCTEKVQKAWIDTWKDRGWIQHEIDKANTWLVSNPKRSKKSFPAYYNNWFNNARVKPPGLSGDDSGPLNEDLMRGVLVEPDK